MSDPLDFLQANSNVNEEHEVAPGDRYKIASNFYLQMKQIGETREWHSFLRDGMPPSLLTMEGDLPRFRRLLKLSSRGVDQVISFPIHGNTYGINEAKDRRAQLVTRLSDHNARLGFAALLAAPEGGNDPTDLCLEASIIRKYQKGRFYSCCDEEEMQCLAEVWPSLDQTFFDIMPWRIASFALCLLDIEEDLGRWNQLSIQSKSNIAEVIWAVSSLVISQQMLDHYCDRQPGLVPFLGQCVSAYDDIVTPKDGPEKAPPWKTVMELLRQEVKAVKNESPEIALPRLLYTMEIVKASAAAENEWETRHSTTRIQQAIDKIVAHIFSCAETIPWLASFAKESQSAWAAWVLSSGADAADIERLVARGIGNSAPYVKVAEGLVVDYQGAEAERAALLQRQEACTQPAERVEILDLVRGVETKLATLMVKTKEVEDKLLGYLYPPKNGGVGAVGEADGPAAKKETAKTSVAVPPAQERSKKKVQEEVVSPVEATEPDGPALAVLPTKTAVVKAVDAGEEEKASALASLSLSLLLDSPGGAWHAARAAAAHGYVNSGEFALKAFALSRSGSPAEIATACQEAFFAGDYHFHGDAGAAGLMAVASGTVLALTAPDNDIVSILQAAELPDNLPSLHGFVRELCSFAARKVPFGADAFPFIEEADELTAAKDNAVVAVQALSVSKQYLNYSYVPARKVMNDWMANKGMIGSQFAAVLSGNIDRDRAEAFVANMMEEDYLVHMMEATIAKLQRRAGAIEHESKRSVIEFCSAAGKAVRAYLDACDAITNADIPFFARQMIESREKISLLASEAKSELEAFDGGLVQKVAARACSVALGNVPALMSGGYKPAKDCLGWQDTGLVIKADTPVNAFCDELAKAVRGAGGYWRRR